MQVVIWVISWDYGTFLPPWTHSSNAHAQPSSGARCLIFGRTLRLLPYFMCANSEGSGETAWMRRLAWAFAGRLCDKYHNLMSWLSSVFYSSRCHWKGYGVLFMTLPGEHFCVFKTYCTNLMSWNRFLAFFFFFFNNENIVCILLSSE